MKINRIMIIGCCGAGKSTLARQLAEKTGLPLIHLDQYYWKPSWMETETKEWENTMHHLVEQDYWIIDGNYGGTMAIRLAKADTIIFLDRSRWLCTWRILKRLFQYRGRSRTDMPEGCRERFDWAFLVYTFTFWDRKRLGLLKRLARLREGQQVFVFRRDKEILAFLDTIKKSYLYRGGSSGEGWFRG